MWNGKMSELLEKQFSFGRLLPGLLGAMLERGYTYTLGCARCAKEGHHRPGSCHYQGLAVDINLFRDGVWLKDGKDHEQFHDLWESWGGAKRINGDFNHYSLEHQGVK
jgi:hypothetical protein